MDARSDTPAGAAPVTHAPDHVGQRPPHAPTPPRQGLTRQRLFLGLGAVVLIFAVAVGVEWLVVGSHHETTDDAYVNADVADVTPLVGGQIISAPASDTMPVKAGDVLAVIDPSDFKLALAQDEAALDQARRQITGAFAQRDAAAAMTTAKGADVTHAEAQVTSAEADLDKARTDLGRRQALAGDGAVSGDELTAAQDKLRDEEADVAAAKAALAEAQANQVSAAGQARVADAVVAGADVNTNPQVAAAEAKVAQAQLDLARTVIRAPIDGVVAKNNVEVGQRVETGAQLMTVVPIQAAYVDANFKESQLRKMHLGQAVTLTSDLYGGAVKFHGKIAGLAGGTGSAFAVIPAQNATGNWIKIVQRLPVRIALDPAELRQHPLRVGLSMTVDVDTAQ
jgi:membrane fusion protein (multidrug efflux system)